jgi:cell division FtsZ-interacting protein ZapD
LDFNYSKNIYLQSDDDILKLNYLKCFIDEIDHLFFNFHHFDLIFIFQKIKISHQINFDYFPQQKKFKEN